MATRAPVVATFEASELVFFAAASGDKISGATRPLTLIVNNASVSSITVTIDPPGNNEYGVANPAKVLTCPASKFTKFKVLPSYRDPADSNLISLSWSATTTVTWTVLG